VVASKEQQVLLTSLANGQKIVDNPPGVAFPVDIVRQKGGGIASFQRQCFEEGCQLGEIPIMSIPTSLGRENCPRVNLRLT
jgi:hypothetical protein